MKSMLGRIIAISATAAAVLLLIVLQTTTPATIGPLGIMIVFILMYVSVLGVLTFLMYWASGLASHVPRRGTPRVHERLSLGRAYYFSSVIALAPVMFIGMQSVGKVGLSDLLLVLFFVVIACIYIAKRTS